MCFRKEFLREILDILVNVTGRCFLGWYQMKLLASPVLTFLFQSIIAVMNWIFCVNFP